MGFLSICEGDPLVETLRKVFDANIVRIPEERIKSLSVIATCNERSSYRGALVPLIEGEPPLGLNESVVTISRMPNISGKHSRRVSIDKVMKKLTFLFLSFMIVIGCVTARKDWENANLYGTIEAYEEFLSKHPDSEYADEAHIKLEKLYLEREWEIADRHGTIEAYEEFLKKYPQSKYSAEAKKKLQKLYLERDWNYAVRNDAIEDYEEFLKNYPYSIYSAEARPRIQKLKAKEAWRKATEQDSMEGYKEFLSNFPNSEYSEEAMKRLELEIAWKEANEKNTVKGYQEFKEKFPRNKYENDVDNYLETNPLEGTIESINWKKGRIVMTTTMGKTETLIIEKNITVKKDEDVIGGLEKLSSGNSVRVLYHSLPGGKFVPDTIYKGYYVSHCSCGDDCSCDLSRGCRSLTY